MKGNVRAIVNMVKAGKPLSGLLVGMATTMGAAGETTPPRTAGVPLMGKMARPIVATNAVSETCATGSIRGMLPVLMGEIAAHDNPKGKYRVVAGDTLSKIAAKHKTTVTDLKKLNGFDDERANKLKVGEIINVAPVTNVPPKKQEPPKQVPAATTNAVNEVRADVVEGAIAD